MLSSLKNSYVSPLSTRYASSEMKYLFSPDKKFTTWRKLWIALAESEMELGLPITKEQIDEMKQYADKINYEVAEAQEKKVRHDVMSHVFAFGEQCPNARPIIHLGATSCYVGDNTDIIIMTEALRLVEKRLAATIAALSQFALNYKDLPTLGYTHFQAAQTTTVGKRATLWIQDLLMDLEDVQHQLENLLEEEREQVSLNCLTVTTKNAKRLTVKLLKKWDLLLALRFPDKRIPEN